MTTDASGQPRQRGLGKGLAALLGETMEPSTTGAREGALLSIPIEHLAPHPNQPRQRFDEAEIESLAASIREKGVVQPLVVRPGPGGDEDGAPYQIVAGERRWRAAQRAGLHELPAVVRQLSDPESIEIALVENLQRSDLNPLEEATAYRHLIREFDHRQEDVASALGKSRSHVANTVRLLDLPDKVKTLVGDGTLSAGHGRALLAAADPAALSDTVVRLGLTVRQTEALVRRAADGRTRQQKTRAADPNIRALQDDLSRALGLRVTIDPARRGAGGRMTIAYKEPEQLDALIGRLRAAPTPRPPLKAV
ncbi:MAG: ParB/RepB/Spo0J family partition protein [Rhodospirillales bacterium]|nr:ParB/RepB/Spo0J family partition protein [Rhodospirillales bacterium]